MGRIASINEETMPHLSRRAGHFSWETGPAGGEGLSQAEVEAAPLSRADSSSRARRQECALRGLGAVRRSLGPGRVDQGDRDGEEVIEASWAIEETGTLIWADWQPL